MHMRAAIAALALAQTAGFAQQVPLARAVGLVIEKPAGVKALLKRPNEGSRLEARTGDLLFEGDELSDSGPGVRYLTCDATGAGTILEKSTESSEPWTVKGKASCRLPRVSNPIPTSSQDGGAGYQPERGDQNGLEGSLASLDEKQRTVVRRELEKFDRILEEQPDSLIALVAKAAILDEHGLDPGTSQAYEAVASRLRWRPAWVMSRLWEAGRRTGEKRAVVVQRPPTVVSSRRTFAVVVGISDYKNNDRIYDLQYAHCDAISFAEFLKSEHGGSVEANDIDLLTDSAATLHAIKSAIQAKLRQASAGDKIILYLSGHGLVQHCEKARARPEDVALDRADETAGDKLCYYSGGGEGHIITHDSLVGGGDISATALSVVELQQLLDESFSRVGEVQVYADVCRAGATVGGLKARALDASGADARKHFKSSGS